VDVDANQEITVKFNVRSIPTVLFFKNGTVVDRIGGAQPKAQFVQKLEQHLS
jgi:thioredoxin 1